MLKTLLALILVLVALGATARAEEAPVQSPEVQAMIKDWFWLNDRCRAGPIGSKSSDQACVDRDALGPKINEAGWCYGIEDQPENEYTFGLCSLITLDFPQPGEEPASDLPVNDSSEPAD